MLKHKVKFPAGGVWSFHIPYLVLFTKELKEKAIEKRNRIEELWSLTAPISPDPSEPLVKQGSYNLWPLLLLTIAMYGCEGWPGSAGPTCCKMKLLMELQSAGDSFRMTPPLQSLFSTRLLNKLLFGFSEKDKPQWTATCQTSITPWQSKSCGQAHRDRKGLDNRIQTAVVPWCYWCNSQPRSLRY